jgi:SAM-dependent methyltransferase
MLFRHRHQIIIIHQTFSGPSGQAVLRLDLPPDVAIRAFRTVQHLYQLTRVDAADALRAGPRGRADTGGHRRIERHLGLVAYVDGCDISADMLHFCRESAEREGFDPRLYSQPMHAIHLPSRYRTIIICASFNLAGNAEQGLAALRRCYEHLEEGGALLFDISAAYASPEEWEQWEPSRRSALPEPWPAEGRRRVAADGSEYVERFRLVDLDPLAQRIVRQVRMEKWVSGQWVDSQELTMHGTLYLPSQVRLMLQVAGFDEITIRSDFTGEPASPESKVLVFTATKCETR